MNVDRILNKAQAMGVRLRLDGDRVKMVGPAAAIASIKPELAAYKPAVVARLRAASGSASNCFGALIAADGGAYLPWGAYLSAADVREMRAELVELIEDLADTDAWAQAFRDEVLSRALRGPVYDLLPNLAHFRERVAEIDAECEARHLLRRRAWRMEGFDDRRVK